MDKREKIIGEEKLYFWAVGLNALLFITEIVGFVYSFIDVGWLVFTYYTELSNMLLLFSAGAVLLSAYFNLRKGCGTNFFTHLTRFIATSSGTLTFLVVIFILIPMYPNPLTLLYERSMLFHHTICPILSIVSFLFFEKEESRNLTYRHIPYGIALTAVYGAIFITLNAVKAFYGPYPFLYVYEQPVWMSIVWFILVFGLSYGISVALYIGNKKILFRGIRHG